MPEMTQEELLQKVNEEATKAVNALRDEIINSMNDKTAKEAKDAAEKAIKEFEDKNTELKDNADFIALKQIVDAVKLQMDDPKREAPKTFIEEVTKAGKEISETIKNGKEYEIKALTNRASVSDSKKANTISSIGQLAVRKMPMLELIPEVSMLSNDDNGTVYYYDWNESTISRAAAMVAEGGTFPESSAKWKWYEVKMKKIGDSIPVTEEFMEDAAPFAAELDSFVETNVMLEEDRQLWNGDNVDENLKGLKTSSIEFVPQPAGIQDANIFDLAIKMKSRITSVGGNKYMPNYILANSNVIDDMILEKDANNNYLRPDFLSFTAEGYPIIKGMIVVENNELGDNEIQIGDIRFAKRHSKTGYVISRGLVNNQFLEDKETIKIRKRTLLLVRAVDEGAFMKCTDINAALITLAS